MPELPEVETIVRQLASVLRGKSFDYAQDQNLIGKQILSVSRKQKIIEIHLSDDLIMLVHLKMTGQLIYVEPGKRLVGGHPTADWVGELPSKHTRATFNFTDGSTLYFNDQRNFGWVRVVPRPSWLVVRGGMAPDVIDPEFTLEYFQKVLKRSRRAIKLVILDQAKMGGMGNIYACDALFLAVINPNTPSDQLKSDAVKKLYSAMIAVLHKGIETGGASVSHFVDTEGVGGHYQDHFEVYDREGLPCNVCRTPIVKFKLGGRGTYFCPKCQKE